MRHLEPYSPNAVKKRKDISDGVMEGWSIESSVSSPNPITPVFQYSLTPTFGSGSAGLGSMPLVCREDDDAFVHGGDGLVEEELDHVDDFGGFDHFGKVAGIGVGFLIPEWGVDSSGADGGDSDVVGDEFLGEGVGKAVHAVFGGTVGSLAEDASCTCDRGDVDDAAVAAFDHLGESQSCAEKGAFEVHINDAFHDIEGLLGKFNVLDDASVVNENVDAAVIGFDDVDGFGYGIFVRNVYCEGKDIVSSFVD